MKTALALPRALRPIAVCLNGIVASRRAPARTTILLACLSAVLMLASWPSSARIIVTGKTTSQISAYVRPLEYMEVTNEQGGWLDNVAMQQLGAWQTPYEAQVRLRITTFPNTFQVRLDQPLVLINAKNQVFRQPEVTLALDGSAAKPLAVGQNTAFENPPPPVAGANSVGLYSLKIAALPPEGDFRQVAGTYTGVLSITFEPVARQP